MTGLPLPLDAVALAEVLSPESMVFGRKGLGGPQPAEADRMLRAEQQAVESDAAWTKARRSDLAQAQSELLAAVTALATAH